MSIKACKGTTKTGEPCKNLASAGREYCHVHDEELAKWSELKKKLRIGRTRLEQGIGRQLLADVQAAQMCIDPDFEVVQAANHWLERYEARYASWLRPIEEEIERLPYTAYLKERIERIERVKARKRGKAA